MPPSKFAKSNHRRSKREGREYQERAVAQTDEGTYPKVDRAGCETFGAFNEPVSETTRLFFQTWMVDGHVVDFVMLHFIQLAPSDDGWYQLARADCAHAVAHVHEDDQGLPQPNTRPLRVLHAVEDVQLAYNDSYDAIFEGWRERERSYLDACRAHPRRRRPTGRLPQGDLPDDC